VSVSRIWLASQWIPAAMIVLAVTNVPQVAGAQSIGAEPLSSGEIQTLRNLAGLKNPENLPRSDAQLRLLIKQAHTFSPLLRELNYAVEAAEQDINVAKGARAPQVTIRGSSTMVTGGIPTANRASGLPYFGVNAAMTVYDFGRIDSTVKNREARKDAAGARYEQQANQVAIETTTVCLEYTKRRALLSAVEDYSQTVQKLVDMLTKVVEADPGRKAELVQAKSRLLQSQQSRESERSGVEQFRIRLNRLIGPDNAFMCDGIGPTFLEKPEIDKIRAAVGAHPQVRAFKYDLEAANRQIDEISASRKPGVQATAAHAPVLPGINNDYYQSITLTASLPIFDGGTLKSSQQAALERARAASERIDLTVLQLDTDYRDRYQLASDNLRRIDEFTSLIEINDRVRKDFFVQWYSLGRRSLFELLAIEQEQYNLQRGYFTSLFDAMISISNIQGNAGMLQPAELSAGANRNN
jgi:adhesin transport system outer membrane protein